MSGEDEYYDALTKAEVIRLAKPHQFAWEEKQTKAKLVAAVEKASGDVRNRVKDGSVALGKRKHADSKKVDTLDSDDEFVSQEEQPFLHTPSDSTIQDCILHFIDHTSNEALKMVI